MVARRLPSYRLPRVRLRSRPGNDLTRQFPLIVETLARLSWRSCIIDGEAVAGDEKAGIACFEHLRHHRVDDSVFLVRFRPGRGLRPNRVGRRRSTPSRSRFARIRPAKVDPGIRFNEPECNDGEDVFRQACRTGWV